MTLIQSIILGIIQGLTEFLPVSSSAHLVITPFLLGWNIPSEEAFVFDVIVQLGTLVAVFAFFWRDLVDIFRETLLGIWRRKPFTHHSAKLGWLIILATIPAGLIGLLVKDLVEAAFNSVVFTCLFLLVTASLLFLAEAIGKRNRKFEDLKWKDALWIGFFQALSIFPGVSRSGSTITGGLFRGIERPAAAKFSFLMSVPVMVLAGLLAMFDLVSSGGMAQQAPSLIAGFVTSASIGYLAIRWLLAYLGRRTLRWFAIYCIVISALTLMIFGLQQRSEAQAPRLSVPATPQVIRVAISTSISLYAEDVYSCAREIPNLAVFVDAIPLNHADYASYDLMISYGMPPNETLFLYQIGEENTVLLVHEDNPVEEMAQESLAAIYSGQITNWDALAPREALPQPIQVMEYDAESDLSRLFREVYLRNGSIVATAMIIPDAETMLEAISETPNAIGYLPESWMDDSKPVKVLQLVSGETELLRQPILVSTGDEPKGILRQLISCLQKA